MKWNKKAEDYYKELLKTLRGFDNLSWYKSRKIPKIVENSKRYKDIAKELDVPAAFIACVHMKEMGSDVGVFKVHIANGQKLSMKTTLVPKGIGPFVGPDAWEQSVRYIIKAKKLHTIGLKNWTTERFLYECEKYNGFGYYNRNKPSAYLWALSIPHGKNTGKFVRDGVYDPNAIPKNIGVWACYKLLIDADSSFTLPGEVKIVTNKKPDMTSFLEKIVAFFTELFKDYFEDVKPKAEEKIKEISKIPYLGERGDHVEAVQQALYDRGYNLSVDGVFGGETENRVSEFQKSKGLKGTGVIGSKTLSWLGLIVKEKIVSIESSTPWMDEIAKDLGKHETDKGLTAKLIPYWPKTGLNYKSLTGSKYAWCGLAVAAYLLMSGVNIDPRGYFRARNLDTIGEEIPYKTYGIPYGAVVTLNNKGNCKLSSNNHVTFSASECTPKMVRTKGAYFIGHGGNQNSRNKESGYAIYKICAVRTPDSKKLPPKKMITENLRCAVGKVATESTR